MFHNLTVTGTVASEPEMRFTATGVPVLNFSVPLSIYKGKADDGSYKYDTVWLQVSVWRQAAERLAETLKKGMVVSFSCEISGLNIYTNREGAMAGNIQVTAQNIRRVSREETGPNSPATNRAIEEGQRDLDEIPF